MDFRYLEELEAFTVSDWYDQSFEEMAEFTRERDIGLMILFMPIPASGYSIDDQPLTIWAEQFTASCPEAVVDGLPLQVWDRELWGNAFHLNRSGAEILTRKVSEKVMDSFGIDR